MRYHELIEALAEADGWIRAENLTDMGSPAARATFAIGKAIEVLRDLAAERKQATRMADRFALRSAHWMNRANMFANLLLEARQELWERHPDSTLLAVIDAALSGGERS